jgi:hypothetical protein
MSDVIDLINLNFSACSVGWPSGQRGILQKRQQRQAKARPTKADFCALAQGRD